MSRWEPDARGRLERVALELYGERGFDQTTVAEIAQRAGLTERTYFRYFADKREVLFGGEGVLHDVFVTAVTAAPRDAGPIDAIEAGLDAVAQMFAGRHDHARRRQAVIDANTALRERELIKLASLSAAIAAALRGRGVAEPAAGLAAEAGIAVFKVAFERWLAGSTEPDLGALMRAAIEELRSLVTAD
ncbi:TetR family transcriptional regulator [Mycobacterium sp. NPDC003449]